LNQRTLFSLCTTTRTPTLPNNCNQKSWSLYIQRRWKRLY